MLLVEVKIGQGGGRGMRHLAESQAGTVEGGGVGSYLSWTDTVVVGRI